MDMPLFITNSNIECPVYPESDIRKSTQFIGETSNSSILWDIRDSAIDYRVIISRPDYSLFDEYDIQIETNNIGSLRLDKNNNLVYMNTTEQGLSFYTYDIQELID